MPVPKGPSLMQEKYVSAEKIGGGGYGKIYRAQRRKDGVVVAVKKVDLSRITPLEQNDALGEVLLTKQLSHPHVVAFFDCFLDGGSLFIEMEYLGGGDLDQLVKRHAARGDYVAEETIWRLCAEMTEGLKYLHDLTILHRDLKPSNIMLDAHGHAKIGDFGFGKLLGAQQRALSCVGTPLYRSPELVRGEPYDNSSDIWALGCIVYELAALRPPFRGADLESRVKSAAPDALPARYSADLAALVGAMLAKAGSARPDAARVLAFPPLRAHLARIYASGGNNAGNGAGAPNAITGAGSVASAERLKAEEDAIWAEVHESLRAGATPASQLPVVVRKLALAHIDGAELCRQLGDARRAAAAAGAAEDRETAAARARCAEM